MKQHKRLGEIVIEHFCLLVNYGLNCGDIKVIIQNICHCHGEAEQKHIITIRCKISSSRDWET